MNFSKLFLNEHFAVLAFMVIGGLLARLAIKRLARRQAARVRVMPLPTTEGKNWREWYELGLRQLEGAAIGAALRSFETALELYPDNEDIKEARLRAARYFTHIPYYKDLVEKS